jgi:putative Holliday junction resolvase
MSGASFVGLDIGDRRIGVAKADSQVKLAVPYMTIEVDGSEISQLAKMLQDLVPDKLIVGLPRNQSGEETEQSNKVRLFVQKLEGFRIPIIFQDESLTSVEAEARLLRSGRRYTKGDIDAEAASIILQDYMESTYGY